MYVLDTNVVSELRKVKSGKADSNVISWANSVDAKLLYLSSITVHELEYGILLTERSDKSSGKILRKWFSEHVLPAFDRRILPVCKQVALVSARFHIPDPKQYRDTLIAATALVHGMTVVTRNVRDFHLPGVSTLNPWD